MSPSSAPATAVWQAAHSFVPPPRPHVEIWTMLTYFSLFCCSSLIVVTRCLAGLLWGGTCGPEPSCSRHPSLTPEQPITCYHQTGEISLAEARAAQLNPAPINNTHTLLNKISAYYFRTLGDLPYIIIVGNWQKVVLSTLSFWFRWWCSTSQTHSFCLPDGQRGRVRTFNTFEA